MPNSSDSKKKDSVFSACFYTILLLAAAGWLFCLAPSVKSPWNWLIRIVALSDLGMVIPIWISLKKRINEINGGEEDAAAQY